MSQCAASKVRIIHSVHITALSLLSSSSLRGSKHYTLQLSVLYDLLARLNVKKDKHILRRIAK